MRKRRRRPKLNTATGEGQFFPGVQKKMKIGKPDDAFEVEADKVADTVVRGNEASNVQKKESDEEEVQQKPLLDTIGTIQKKCDSEQEESVQKMEEEDTVQKMEKEQETVQQKEEKATTTQRQDEQSLTGPSAIASKLSSTKGRGHKMDNKTLSEMESGFGTDFSNVNIHTNAEANILSNQLGAQAFTHGNDVYFNKGKYNPSSTEGKHLLAHELTHTIQQNGKSTKKIQKQQAANPNRTSFSGTYTNQLSVPFYSTEERPNIRIIINHRALVDQMSSCAEIHARIDNAERTKTVIPTIDTRTTRTVLNFTMQNAMRHTLYLTLPDSCRNVNRVRVSGSITRRR